MEKLEIDLKNTNPLDHIHIPMGDCDSIQELIDDLPEEMAELFIAGMKKAMEEFGWKAE
ncbi:hypothetical protein [Burkholderia contaminans]|uniref:hypothetical protein n=1 Tax=Burkholderia contaminans TaxID=488447 RepID=UPI00158EE192|nr:hypothetical protein [Burkholderia contaminans]